MKMSWISKPQWGQAVGCQQGRSSRGRRIGKSSAASGRLAFLTLSTDRSPALWRHRAQDGILGWSRWYRFEGKSPQRIYHRQVFSADFCQFTKLWLYWFLLELTKNISLFSVSLVLTVLTPFYSDENFSTSWHFFCCLNFPIKIVSI